MPSLFKYFVTVGAILFVGLVGLNAVMEKGGPGPRIVQDTPKAKLVRHDPRASLVERLREEEAAQKAAGKAEASAVQQPVITISTAPPAPAPKQVPAAAAQPAAPQVAVTAQPQAAKLVTLPVAPAQVQATEPAVQEQRSAPAALTGLPTEEETRAARVTQEKAAAEKARKKRVARDRARAREDAAAARQQDQIYYAQRPAYAYAPPPRPAFGPFSQAQNGWFGGGGGWGRGW